MKRPIPHNVPASGTYEVTDRLTKMRIAAPTFEQLLNKINHARSATGVVTGLDLRTEVENWICEERPGDCSEVDMNIPRKRHLTLTDILRGTRVMVAFKLAGSPLVDREEAMRRGEICKTCQFNQKFDKPCTGWCPELATIVRDIIGNQGLPVDAYLHGCGICGCFLPAAIWLPLELQCLGVNDIMKQQFKAIPNCWKVCEPKE